MQCGSAFAPVIEYVVNLVYKLMKALQSVIYAITKVNIFANASASSYSSMADSASDAAESTKALAGVHDEINNINSSSSSSSGSDSSSPNFDLSTVDTSSSLLDAIENGDWYAVGEALATKINDALDSIDWTSIQVKTKTIATNIGNFINGFVDGLDWNLLGSTIGNGIKTALVFVNTLLTTINFQNIGSGIAKLLNSAIDMAMGDGLLGTTIANGINGAIDAVYGFVMNIDLSNIGKTIIENILSFIDSIDWGDTAKKLSDGIIKIFTELKEFILTINWGEIIDTIINAIIDFITNVDLSGISDSIFTALGTACASLVNLGEVLGGYIAQAFTNIVDYFQDEIEECGGNIVLGILKGIGDAVIGIAQWIYEHIFQPFIDGFKNAFGINSPSTVMAEMGGYIIEGLKNGLSNIWETIKSIFTNLVNNIIGKFQEIAEGIRNKVEEIKNNLSEKWENIKSTASTAWENVKSNVTTKVESIKTTVGSKIDTLKSNISTKWDSIKTTASTKWNNIKSTVVTTAENLKTSASEKISSLKDNISTTFNNLTTSATTWGKDVVSNLASGISSAKDKVTSAVNSVASKIKSLLGFSEPEEGPLSNFHTYMPDMMNLMAEGIHDNMEQVTSELENLTGTMSYTINTNGITDTLLDSFSVNSSIDGSNLETQNVIQSSLESALSKYMSSDSKQPVNITLIVGQEKLGSIVIDDLRQRVRRSGKGIEAIVG